MRGRRAAVAAVIVAVATVVAGGLTSLPAGAVDQPLVSVPADHAAPDDEVTATVTGCTGTPQLLVDFQVGVPSGESSVPVTEVTPGRWEGSVTMPTTDIGLTAQCASGARSAQVVIDVDSPILLPDPWNAQAPDYQMDAAVGTDCPQPTAKVQFSVGDWIRVDHPATDHRGDFRSPAPQVGHRQTISVNAWCDGVSYIPFTFWTWTGRNPPPPRRAVEMDAGGGPAGSTVSGLYPCYQQPSITARDAEGPVDVSVTWNPSPPRYRFTATSRDTDVTVELRCSALDHESLRYDVEHPTLVLTGEGSTTRQASTSTPLTAVGTDCPPGANVAFRVVGEGRELSWGHAHPDLWGDWTLRDLAADLPPGQATLTASCGSVTYAPVRFEVGGSTTTTTTRSDDRTTPAPAQPVSGAASYTG